MRGETLPITHSILNRWCRWSSEKFCSSCACAPCSGGISLNGPAAGRTSRDPFEQSAPAPDTSGVPASPERCTALDLTYLRSDSMISRKRASCFFFPQVNVVSCHTRPSWARHSTSSLRSSAVSVSDTLVIQLTALIHISRLVPLRV